MYTGREYDRGLKLYYNRARYYNPKLGRFISRDPIDIADDVNLYAYVGNNGVMFVDRMGLEKVLIMYSPNHWYDLWSTEITANNIKDYLYGKGYSNVELKPITTSNDFTNNISSFNKKNNSGEILYIGHNQGWLSKNMTDVEINKLPSIKSDITLTLFSCATVLGENNKPTWSNQVAQKLSNQLNTTVYGSTELISAKNNNISITDGTWKEVQPGGNIERIPSIIDYFIPQAN